MALSEQERKLLEQLEASLKADDPKLADTLSGSASIRVHRRRAALAGLGFIVGVILLLSGISINPAVSVLGFIVMLAAVLVGLSSWQRVEGTRTRAKQPRQPAGSTAQDFMTRLEEQWRRRRRGED